MSGTGKTHWSKKLAKKGFIRYCCDELIEESLGDILKKQGYRGIQDVAKWMGQPYNSQYPKTCKAYLIEETKVMQKLLNNGIKKPNNQNIVIDTTGSSIYTGTKVLKELAAKTTVVYLETSQEVQDEMFRLYIADPKPVIWGDVFKKEKNESDQQALARCYPMLLKTRGKKYKNLAHKALDYHKLRKPGYSVADFLAAVQTA